MEAVWEARLGVIKQQQNADLPVGDAVVTAPALGSLTRVLPVSTKPGSAVMGPIKSEDVLLPALNRVVLQVDGWITRVAELMVL